MFRESIESLNRDPLRWFLIDGLGAALSALLTGSVLVRFEEQLGLPSTTLSKLACAACIVFAYDVYHFLCKDSGPRFLRTRLLGLASLNAAYALMSLVFALHHLQKLTLSGWVYILLEVVVVGCLAVMECRAAHTEQ